jgi:hypothetical protein
MSTICKLDRNVRLDRYLRKQMLRDLRSDAARAASLVARGEKIVQHPDWKRYTNAAQFKHAKLLQEMTVRAAVLKLTFRHISKICLDPRRTGAAKEAILAKLGAPKQ